MSLFPQMSNEEVLKLCYASQRSCRCDGGGSTCSPCQADTQLTNIGIALDNENIKAVIAKLELPENPKKGGEVGFYCCQGRGHAKDCPNVKMGHVTGDTGSFYRPDTVQNSLPGIAKAHFNGLTPGELERLAILQEECGEVIRSIGKILRHGYESYHPNKVDHVGNRGELELELGDIYGTLSLMYENGDVSEKKIICRIPHKRARILQYAHHQE